MPTINPQVKRIMEGLGCTREEAEEIYEDDKKVDRMSMAEINASMTEEEKAVIKAMTRARDTQKAVNAYGKTVNRVRKEDTDKEDVVALIAETLTKNGYNEVEVTNKAREINFKSGDRRLKLVLSAPR